MKALILSGGMASRLWPLSYTQAKQLLPIANKPILFYAIETIVKAGIKDIGIVVGHTKEQLIRVVGNGERWGVKITYIPEEQPKGLAHAVKTAQHFLQQEPFVLFLGDNIIKENLKRFIKAYHDEQFNAMVILDKVNDPENCGISIMKEGDIQRLVEKPREYISKMGIVGLYIFDKNIFSAIDSIKPSWRNELEITDAIQQMIDTGSKVGYGQIQDWWKDTGMPEDMLEANQRLLNESETNIEGRVDENSVLQGKIILGKGSQIMNSVIRGPVTIGENCIVAHAYIGPYTSISAECKIENSEIEYSIILNNTCIQDVKNKISNSLIGSNVSISGYKEKAQAYSLIIGDNSKINIV